MKRANIKSKSSIRKQATAQTAIDDYLVSLPTDSRAALERLRKIIRTAAPKAVETISYQIPTFKYLGSLVGFAAFSKHCSFFLMSTSAMAAHKEELSAYETTKSAIHFAVDGPLPAALVKKLVKARIRENETRSQK